MSIRNELIKEIEHIKNNSTVKGVWVIEYGGVRLNFGAKSGWSKISSAKNALRLRLHAGSYRERLPELKKMEEEGIIKYVKL